MCVRVCALSARNVCRSVGVTVACVRVQAWSVPGEDREKSIITEVNACCAHGATCAARFFGRSRACVVAPAEHALCVQLSCSLEHWRPERKLAQIDHIAADADVRAMFRCARACPRAYSAHPPQRSYARAGASGATTLSTWCRSSSHSRPSLSWYAHARAACSVGWRVRWKCARAWCAQVLSFSNKSLWNPAKLESFAVQFKCDTAREQWRCVAADARTR